MVIELAFGLCTAVMQGAEAFAHYTSTGLSMTPALLTIVLGKVLMINAFLYSYWVYSDNKV